MFGSGVTFSTAWAARRWRVTLRGVRSLVDPPSCRRRALLRLGAVACTGLTARAALAQPSASVTARNSSITVFGAPWHLLLHARNGTPRAVTVRVVAAEYHPPTGPPVPLDGLELRVDGAPTRGVVTLAPGFDRDLVLTFRYAGGAAPATLTDYTFVVRVQVDGREQTSTATVARAIREPIRR